MLARILSLLLLASSAYATVGGSTELTVLGHEPVDNKVYLLRAVNDESGYPPGIVFYDLNESWPVLHTDRSWHQLEADVHVKRLTALKTRLKPMRRMPMSAGTMTVKKRGTEICPTYMQDIPCEVVDVTIKMGARSRTHRLYDWPGPRTMKAAYALPGGGHLALMTHRGETFEHGYAQDVPFLMPKRPAPKGMQAWTANCTPGKCALQVGKRTVIEVSSDQLRCAEGSPWLGCVGKTGERWLGWFVHRATGATVMFGVPHTDAVLGAPTWGPKGLMFKLKSGGETHRIAPPG